MIGGIQGMSGASSYMPMTAKVSQSSDNSFETINPQTANTAINATTSSANSMLSAEMMIQMLTQNMQNPMGNISSNDFLSMLQNNNNSSTQSNNKSSDLMNTILSSYASN